MLSLVPLRTKQQRPLTAKPSWQRAQRDPHFLAITAAFNVIMNTDGLRVSHPHPGQHPQLSYPTAQSILWYLPTHSPKDQGAPLPQDLWQR